MSPSIFIVHLKPKGKIRLKIRYITIGVGLYAVSSPTARGSLKTHQRLESAPMSLRIRTQVMINSGTLALKQ